MRLCRKSSVNGLIVIWTSLARDRRYNPDAQTFMSICIRRLRHSQAGSGRALVVIYLAAPGVRGWGFGRGGGPILPRLFEESLFHQLHGHHFSLIQLAFGGMERDAGVPALQIDTRV